jgi:hypothetical protein
MRGVGPFHHTQPTKPHHTIMIRERRPKAFSLPSSSSSSLHPRLPLVSVLLVAAVLTALGAISHSGTVRGLYPSSSQEDDVIFYDRVARNPHRQRWYLLDATPKFQRTKYTFDSFVVAGGIDLAGFGLDDDDTLQKSPPQYHDHESFFFELFEDFDLSHRLKGNETWIELLEYRRDATHPSLSFYVDKVAFKRWLVTSYADLKIEGIKSFLLKYASELHREIEFVQRATQNKQLQHASTTKSKEHSLVAQELLRWLPTDLDYAAKPTHLSCSGGVWLVHNNIGTNTTYVGNGKKKLKAFVAGGPTTTTTDKQNNNHSGGIVSTSDDPRHQIAEDLSTNLQKVQEKCGRTVLESYALRHVRPGIVVEERFTQPSRSRGIAGVDDNDNEALLKGGMEFKVFTIWGRAWLIVWRPGMDGVKALFFRNGTNLVFDPPLKNNNKTTKKSTKTTTKGPNKTVGAIETALPETPTLPEWIDWDKVISIGETLGRHKDMFRTDIFVGVATSTASHNRGGEYASNNNYDQSSQIRYVVSETEIHPTPLRGFETVFEEAGRLWLAGYYLLPRQQQKDSNSGRSAATLVVVPNTEVPMTFYNRDVR